MIISCICSMEVFSMPNCAGSQHESAAPARGGQVLAAQQGTGGNILIGRLAWCTMYLGPNCLDKRAF